MGNSFFAAERWQGLARKKGEEKGPLAVPSDLCTTLGARTPRSDDRDVDS